MAVKLNQSYQHRRCKLLDANSHMQCTGTEFRLRVKMNTLYNPART